MRRLLLLIIIVSLAACATAPEMDGGIVGTGNRIDCEALAKKDAPLPEECRRRQ
jgi:hypothetical protein